MTMRRTFTVFLAVCILLIFGFVSVHVIFIGVADDVQVTRETLYGDPSAVDGARILARNMYHRNLLWETSMIHDEELEVSTEFTFSNENIIIPKEPAWAGIEIGWMRDLFFFNSSRLPESSRIKYEKLLSAMDKMIESIPNGGQKSFGLDFGKYLDYYPLDGQVILPQLSTVFSEFEHWFSDSEAISKAINDFFRIPITGAFSVDYRLDKKDNHTSGYASMNVDYQFHASGVATENACYFTFDATMEDGSVVDTSLIPGGYGIYCLPYEGSVLKLDQLKMVYSLDPTEGYESMALAGDGKYLLLHTWNDDDLMLTVIDIATMTQIQRVNIHTRSSDVRLDVICYDDFILMVENSSVSDELDRLTVWEECPDHSWKHSFTVRWDLSMIPDGDHLDLFNTDTNAVDFKDGKLVLVTNKIEEYRSYRYQNYCDFYVLVFEESGMTYAGSYHLNLTDVNSQEPGSRRVRNTTDLPLEVSW